MAHYRLYFLDASNQISTTAEEFDCQTDDYAIAEALRIEDQRDSVLWSGTRLVARLVDFKEQLSGSS
jgi:hypothetical protein